MRPHYNHYMHSNKKMTLPLPCKPHLLLLQYFVYLIPLPIHHHHRYHPQVLHPLLRMQLIIYLEKIKRLILITNFHHRSKSPAVNESAKSLRYNLKYHPCHRLLSDTTCTYTSAWQRIVFVAIHVLRHTTATPSLTLVHYKLQMSHHNLHLPHTR